MGEKTLKFSDIVADKKFHASKQPIALNLVNINQILISDKLEHNDKGFKYFIGYKEDDIIRPLCIILPEMSGYIKHFDNGEKKISFKVEDDSILVKYNEIWNKIKEIKVIKFHNPVYDKKYIKCKVKEFNSVAKTNLWGDKTPEEGVHYTCIACISIDSVIKVVRKNYLQVYLEE